MNASLYIVVVGMISFVVAIGYAIYDSNAHPQECGSVQVTTPTGETAYVDRCWNVK